MPKDALLQDEENQFTGVTVKIISVSNIKTQIVGVDLFVRIKCKDKFAQTQRKINERDTIIFDKDFFYNTTEIIDDDISFELYEIGQGQGASKILVSSSRIGQSKLQGSKINDAEGRLVGATKQIQISREKRQKQQKTLELLSQQKKVVGKVKVSFQYLERQDVVGGIKCPLLSLRPDKSIKPALTLENKFASYKNLYSFLDGNQTPNCEFFPKKFHH